MSASAPGLNWLMRRGALGWYERRRWRMRRQREGTRPVPGRPHPAATPPTSSASSLGHWDDAARPRVRSSPIHASLPSTTSASPPTAPSASPRAATASSRIPSASPACATTSPAIPLRRIDWKATARPRRAPVARLRALGGAAPLRAPQHRHARTLLGGLPERRSGADCLDGGFACGLGSGPPLRRWPARERLPAQLRPPHPPRPLPLPLPAARASSKRWPSCSPSRWAISLTTSAVSRAASPSARRSSSPPRSSPTSWQRPCAASRTRATSRRRRRHLRACRPRQAERPPRPGRRAAVSRPAR